jgi:hypothetical protein
LDAPGCIRFGDKLTYLLAIFDALFTAYVVLVYPFALPWVYTVKFPILIGIRVFDYAVRNSWGWFLIDFCYAGNVLLLVYLWLFPNWTQLFNIAFAVLLLCVHPLFNLVYHDANVHFDRFPTLPMALETPSISFLASIPSSVAHVGVK